MADTKITALTALTGADPANDVIPIVDVSDTTMAASGTTKKISVNNILGASGTATLASATITGDLTVDTSTLYVSSSTDKVGIGTTSLSNEKLTVAGNISANAWLGRSNISAPAGDCSIFRSADNTLAFGIASTTAMTLNSTGLGVGGSPSAKIHAQGTGVLGLFTQGAAPATGLSAVTIQAPVASGFSSLPVLNFWYQNTGISNPASECFAIRTSSTDRLYIDATGNVGIGVTPSAWFASDRALEFREGWGSVSSSNGTGAMTIANNAYESAGGTWTYKNTNGAGRYEQLLGVHKWFNAPSGTAGTAITFTQAMTLDASGRLYVGLTSSPYGTSRSWFSYDGGTVYGAGYKNITAGNGTAVVFVSSTNGLAGYISTTDTTVTYASVSDYRLKQDVKPLSGGLARINALKPSIYKWKSDGSSAEGFIAHELAEVVPSAVIGSKDEVNEDGSIKAQGVDLSRVVPVLVAAIQELTARVQTLETR